MTQKEWLDHWNSLEHYARHTGDMMLLHLALEQQALIRGGYHGQC